MKLEELLSYIELLVEEQVSEIKNIKGKRGLRGPRGEKGLDGKDGIDGKDGNDFSWESFEPKLINKIKEYSIKGDKGERGPRGYAGKPGVDGKDGIGFNFEDHKEEIEKIIKSYRLKYEDLTKDQIDELRGPRGFRGQRGLPGRKGDPGKDGKDGKDGHDFIFSEHEEKIFEIINKTKLKFSDLSENEKQELRGPRGFRGQKGKAGLNGQSAYEIWLEKNKGSKLDFLMSLVGPKGFDGAKGEKGDKGDKGDPGFDGKDAPEISKVRIIKVKDSFKFRFSFEDGTVLTTNQVDLPTGDKKTYLANNTTVTFKLTVEDEGTPISNNNIRKLNFVGDLVEATETEDGVATISISNAEAGIVIPDIACDASVYIGSAVYIDNSNIAQNALADNILTSNVLGFVESKSSTVLCDVRVSGRTLENFTGLDVTKDYYLSDTVAGGIQTSVPTTSGHVKIRLGQPITDQRFVFLKGEPIIRA